LQDGVATTGVSVAFTVLKCDAGPIFLQETAAVPEDEQAPELLDRLFKQGAQLLVNNMERVWSGEAAQVAKQQDEAQATHAAKVSRHNIVTAHLRKAASCGVAVITGAAYNVRCRRHNLLLKLVCSFLLVLGQPIHQALLILLCMLLMRYAHSY
jgi:methionyl-tRNA formyltransferase